MPKTISEKILAEPIFKWPTAITREWHKSPEVGFITSLGQELSYATQKSFLLERYMHFRYYGGQSDVGHDKAVKQAMKALVKLRKLMGFAEPANLPFHL